MIFDVSKTMSFLPPTGNGDWAPKVEVQRVSTRSQGVDMGRDIFFFGAGNAIHEWVLQDIQRYPT